MDTQENQEEISENFVGETELGCSIRPISLVNSDGEPPRIVALHTSTLRLLKAEGTVCVQKMEHIAKQLRLGPRIFHLGHHGHSNRRFHSYQYPV